MREYCITYIAEDDIFEEECHYYIWAKTMIKALKRFKKHRKIMRPKIVLSIRLLEA